MCDYSKRLVAWMDGELAANEAAEVEQHVQACPVCGKCVSACEEVCLEFAGYYAALTQAAGTVTRKRSLSVWVPAAAAVAAVAAILVFAFVPRAAKQAPTVQQATASPAKSRAGMEPLVIHPLVKDDGAAGKEITEAAFPQRLKPRIDRVRVGTAKSRALTREAYPTAPRGTKNDWAMAEPAIQIAIPADAMFPPGAVPQGINYIANVSLGADGTVQGIRLQP